MFTLFDSDVDSAGQFFTSVIQGPLEDYFGFAVFFCFEDGGLWHL